MNNRPAVLLAALAVTVFPAAALATDLKADAPATGPAVVWVNPYGPVPTTTPDPGVRPVAATTPSPSATTASPSPSKAAPAAVRTQVKPSPSNAAPAPVRTTVKPKPSPSKAGPKVYTLSPVTALNDQSAIDRGNLVTWMTSPTCLLAGHDTMGWAWLDNVPKGSVLKVTRGPCAGRYEVVAHKWQSVKGGPIPGWMSGYDLVLQTCTGSSGMGFSAARRV